MAYQKNQVWSTFRGGCFTYLQWAWLDLLSVLSLCALLCGVYFIPVAHFTGGDNRRLVPMWFENTTLRGPIELSYPNFEPRITSWACGMFAAGIPTLVIAVFQIRLRSFWDFQTGTLGNVKALVLASV